MNGAGQINVRAEVSASGVDWQLACQRPNLAQSLLEGVSAGEAVQRVDRVYLVCRQAQGAAARLATCPELPEAAALVQLNRKVMLESIEQTLWRLVIDLPHTLSIGEGLAPFAKLRRIISEQLAGQRVESLQWSRLSEQLSAFFKVLTGMSVDAWLAMSAQSLEKWRRESDSLMACVLNQVVQLPCASAETALLPARLGYDDLAYLGHALAARGDFDKHPELYRVPGETGPLSYMQDHPLVAELIESKAQPLLSRYVARLCYLATLLRQPARENDWHTQPLLGAMDYQGQRLAWVYTARGLLLHQARLGRERIRRYRICAPTEWNFHPRGAAPLLLSGIDSEAPELLRRCGELTLLALDPCVPFNLGVQNA